MDKQMIRHKCAGILTFDEAYEIAASLFWESGEWMPVELALMQLRQDRCVMNFDVYQAGVEELLGRPVMTHELIYPADLMEEYEGKRAAPDRAEVVGKMKTIRQGKPTIIVEKEGVVRDDDGLWIIAGGTRKPLPLIYDTDKDGKFWIEGFPSNDSVKLGPWDTLEGAMGGLLLL